MRVSKTLRTLAVLALASAAAWAADITGKWTGQLSGPDGGEGMTITFTFKQDGAKLTGSVEGPGGEPVQIQEGKIDGDKISFTTAFGEMKILNTGVVKDDEITLTVKFQGGGPGGPGGPEGGMPPMKLKRAK